MGLGVRGKEHDRTSCITIQYLEINFRARNGLAGGLLLDMQRGIPAVSPMTGSEQCSKAGEGSLG